ncbi:uncharacterized protein K460DRAFT_280998, partial [Cucurbitaria berberidis CBS 394.84]
MAVQCGALTENIALLALCDTTLEPMIEDHPPPEKSPEIDSYKLSFQHEQQVTEAFAVLLANTDDPNKVGAICLEEQPDGLLIRTAVNSGDQKDRKASFERIARALESCTAGPSAQRDEETFFGEIIAACQSRLLGRLRSSNAKPARKAGKQAILTKLCDGVRLLDGFPTRPPQLALVKNHISLLEDAFTRLESLSYVDAHSEPGRQILKSILLSIEQMLASTDIKTLLGLIPKNIPAWSGIASQSLARSLKSLAQYQDAAHYLLRRACRDPTFRHLRIADV